MAKQAVNTGVLPNDGQGDNLRSGAVSALDAENIAIQTAIIMG